MTNDWNIFCAELCNSYRAKDIEASRQEVLANLPGLGWTLLRKSELEELAKQ